MGRPCKARELDLVILSVATLSEAKWSEVEGRQCLSLAVLGMTMYRERTQHIHKLKYVAVAI
jgi:hypothetical protein